MNTSRRLKRFERAAALRPADASSLVNIASSYAGLQKFPEAVEAYRKAFTIQPSLLFEPFVNHEYGITLVDSGDLEGASEVFGKMKAQPEPSKKARGHRSQAFLEMYRGRYDLAISELRQALVITKTLGARISEFRERLLLTRALDAKGRSREAGVELAAVERLMDQLSLGPEWLRILAVIQARRGDVGQARRVVDLMTKTSGAAAADSTTNRNIEQDRAYVAQGRGELALAEGRAADAVGILEGARVGASADAEIIDALAKAQAAAGNLDAAATGYQEVIASRALGFEAQEVLAAGAPQARRGLRTARPARRRARAICAADRALEGWRCRSHRPARRQGASF